MTTEELRVLKAELDSKISDLVIEFENATAFDVETIVVKRNEENEVAAISVIA